MKVIHQKAALHLNHSNTSPWNGDVQNGNLKILAHVHKYCVRGKSEFWDFLSDISECFFLRCNNGTLFFTKVQQGMFFLLKNGWNSTENEWTGVQLGHSKISPAMRVKCHYLLHHLHPTTLPVQNLLDQQRCDCPRSIPQLRKCTSSISQASNGLQLSNPLVGCLSKSFWLPPASPGEFWTCVHAIHSSSLEKWSNHMEPSPVSKAGDSASPDDSPRSKPVLVWKCDLVRYRGAASSCGNPHLSWSRALADAFSRLLSASWGCGSNCQSRWSLRGC